MEKCAPPAGAERRRARARLEPARPDHAPERGAVVPTRLLREAEERKEEERGARVDPAAHLVRGDGLRVRAPERGGDLEHAPELVVRVGPGDPRRDVHAVHVHVDAVDPQGDGQQHLEEGEQHEAGVAADRHGRSRR